MFWDTPELVITKKIGVSDLDHPMGVKSSDKVCLPSFLSVRVYVRDWLPQKYIPLCLKYDLFRILSFVISFVPRGRGDVTNTDYTYWEKSWYAHLLETLFCLLYNFACFFFLTSDKFFFKITIFTKFFQEYYQSVKQFGSRSGPTFCRGWSGSKLFAKVVCRRH